MMDDGLVGITRRVQHLHDGSQLCQLLGQLPTAEPWDDDIREQQVDRTVMLGGESQRRLAVGCLQDHVAETLEHLSRHHANGRRVLDDEHSLGAAAWLRGCRRRGGGLGGLVDSREVDLEARPVTGLGVHPDESARLLHDSVHPGKAQTPALSRFLCRKERLEKPGPWFLVYAAFPYRQR